MIFEHAVNTLPEVLAGTGYPYQEHEGGIVAAFSMATLQELNSRNVPNPLSCVQCEKLFRDKPAGWESLKPDQKKRYLRADIRLSLHTLRVGNRALAAFGWRHDNWLEAKFFRSFSDKTGLPITNKNQSIHTGSLLADLLRILALCPRGVPRKIESNPEKRNLSNVGRYLLHVYSGEVSQHLSLMRRGGTKRIWLEAITSPGQHSVSGFSVRQEPTTIRKYIGPELGELVVDFNCSNFVVKSPFIFPRQVTYTCILTRFDSFKLQLGDDHWGLESDRSITSSYKDDKVVLSRIAEFVGSRISLKGPSETKIPAPTNVENESDDEEGLDEESNDD